MRSRLQAIDKENKFIRAEISRAIGMVKKPNLKMAIVLQSLGFVLNTEKIACLFSDIDNLIANSTQTVFVSGTYSDGQPFANARLVFNGSAVREEIIAKHLQIEMLVSDNRIIFERVKRICIQNELEKYKPSEIAGVVHSKEFTLDEAVKMRRHKPLGTIYLPFLG